MAACCDDNEHDPRAQSVSSALERILNAAQPITEHVQLPLDSALGRILAAPVAAAIDVPAWDNSAMDGYALRCSDGSGPRRPIGTALAGHPWTGELGQNDCLRIMTGAPVPAAADVVVPQEQCSLVDGLVHLHTPLRPGANIRRVGEDIRRGEAALPSGTRLQPAQLALLASLGVAEVSVYRPLRVAFFSTGDELQGLGQPLASGQIYDSNRHALLALLRRLGIDALDLGRVADRTDALEAALGSASQMADVIISTGGVSVGEADYITALLGRLGQVDFWKMNMKPGRPLAFGRIGTADFFGLPGNPVSTMVTFYQFVRPLLLKRMGQNAPWTPPTLHLPAATPLRKKPGRTDFQRGRLVSGPSGLQVAPVGAQSSHILTGMAQAECFMILPAEAGDLPAGSLVEIQLLEGLA